MLARGRNRAEEGHMKSELARKRWLTVATVGLALLAVGFSALFDTVLWFGACGDAPGRPICPFLEHGGGSPLLVISPSAAILIGGSFAVRGVRVAPLLGGLLIAIGVYVGVYVAYVLA
jgi:hypothetical protein